MGQFDERLIEIGIQLKNKKNELNSLNESHKKMIRKLIHNLKNPIGVVSSFSEMILDDVQNIETAKLIQRIGIIKKSADFTLNFLNKTSQHTRLQSSEVVFLIKKITYTNLLKQVINDIIPLALEKEISIIHDFNQLDTVLLIDDIEMYNALNYILSNAIRFSKNNTSISITVSKIDSFIETKITDQGIGISNDNLLKIFEPYFVVETYSENGEKCIGLELTMAEKIVKKHKGEISISSDLGLGSTVNILLPI